MSLQDVRRMQSGSPSRGGFSEYVKELKLGDRDTVRGFFLEEPSVFLMHRTTKIGGRKFSFERCAKVDHDDPSPCRWCAANVQGDLRINRTSPRVFFSFQPTTLFHSEPVRDERSGKPITTKKGDPIFNERPCRGKKCKLCASGDVAVAVGVRRFEIALMFAEVLMARVDDISEFATAGWSSDEDARIPVTRIGWACGNCGAKYKESSYTMEKLLDRQTKKCLKCEKDVLFEERLSAEGIEDPIRCSLTSGEWKITRNGVDKGTTFTFDFLKVAEPPAEAFENLVDFNKTYPLRSAKKVEELLGGERGTRPMVRAGGATSYDDEGEEDEEPETTAKPARRSSIRM